MYPLCRFDELPGACFRDMAMPGMQAGDIGGSLERNLASAMDGY
jgi:hypothetical protein